MGLNPRILHGRAHICHHTGGGGGGDMPYVHRGGGGYAESPCKASAFMQLCVPLQMQRLYSPRSPMGSCGNAPHSYAP